MTAKGKRKKKESRKNQEKKEREGETDPPTLPYARGRDCPN
jgi:hypothetical protein